jgi:AraC-like DNA-binding protein/mannose-6-phosphate isomerase-like protein (cupin superfamily)
MVEFDVALSYFALMRYVRPGTAPPQGTQLLQVVHHGRPYRLSILHATLEERRNAEQQVRATEHVHDVYHILLFTRGRNSVSINGQRVPVRPGSLIVTQPGERHDFGPNETGELAYREATFELVRRTDVLNIPFHLLLSYYCGSELKVVSYPFELNTRQRRHLELRFQLLMQQLAVSTRSRQLGVCRAMLDLFSFLVLEVYCGDAGVVARSDSIDAARAILETQFAEQLDLDELADSAQLSVAYFCRAFKARYRISPIAMQKQLRIQAAKNLLLTSGLSIKEIASQVGFSDVYTFSKSFKRISGISPSAFQIDVRSRR